MSDIQALVDALAAELERSVGLDDHRFRALSYSSHTDRVDQVRMVSLLQREASGEVTSWLESVGVREAEGFVRIAGNASLGMSARICVPVRFDGILLGFLWLIDEPDPLAASQLEEAVRYADELALALYRARVLEQNSRERERELIGQLIAEGESEAAAAELITEGYLAASHGYLVLVLCAHHERGEQTPDPIQLRLVDAAERLRRSIAPQHVLVRGGKGEAVVVLVPSSPQDVSRRAEALAESGAKVLAGYPEWNARVGVGEECETLSSLRRSYRQAHDAVRVALALNEPRHVVRWSDLGAYRTVVGLLGESDVTGKAPESLRRLLAADDGELLVRTLERYLDLGGDARAAATALYIHRSSLYARLRKIEEIAEVDLRSGDDRLELHLGIRVLRLAGGGDLLASPGGVCR